MLRIRNVVRAKDKQVFSTLFLSVPPTPGVTGAVAGKSKGRSELLAVSTAGAALAVDAATTQFISTCTFATMNFTLVANGFRIEGSQAAVQKAEAWRMHWDNLFY